jgi:hypothetical protein
VLLGVVEDSVLAVLDDGHNQVVWPLPDKALVNLQRPSYCVEEACHIDEVFVFAPYRVRDFDEAVHGSEDIKVYFAAETVPCLCRPLPLPPLAALLQQTPIQVFPTGRPRGEMVFIETDLGQP